MGNWRQRCCHARRVKCSFPLSRLSEAPQMDNRSGDEVKDCLRHQHRAKINSNRCCAGRSILEHANKKYQVILLEEPYAGILYIPNRPQVVPSYQLLPLRIHLSQPLEA